MIHLDENRGVRKSHHFLDETVVSFVPSEFVGVIRSERSDALRTVEYWLLFWGSLAFVIGCLVHFLTRPFLPSGAAFRALPLESSESIGIVTYLDSFEEKSGSKMKDIFGWGGLDLISRASQALAPHLQSCRTHLSGVARANMQLRFDVKVMVNKPGFKVTGLLEGADQEPVMASCLRDKIEGLSIADFANLRAAAPKAYKLRIGVQMAHGSDGGAP